MRYVLITNEILVPFQGRNVIDTTLTKGSDLTSVTGNLVSPDMMHGEGADITSVVSFPRIYLHLIMSKTSEKPKVRDSL